MQPTGVLETSKATNPLRTLLECGQSVWLDYIRRDLITSGKLKRLIDEDGLRGITSNPAIFEKAIAESSDYDGMLKELASRPELDATARFEQIAIRDIQDAADLSMRARNSAMDLSAWKSLLTWHTKPKKLWKKPAGCGRR